MIDHCEKNRNMFIWGYSKHFGKANYDYVAELLQEKFTYEPSEFHTSKD